MEGGIAPQGAALAAGQWRGRGSVRGNHGHGRGIVDQDGHVPDAGLAGQIKVLEHFPVADGLRGEKKTVDLAGIVLFIDRGSRLEWLAGVRVFPFQDFLERVAEDKVPISLHIVFVPGRCRLGEAAGQDGQQA